MACSHANTTSNQDRLAPELVDVEDCGDGEEEFEDADDTGGQEGDSVTAQSEVAEDERSVVVDCLRLIGSACVFHRGEKRTSTSASAAILQCFTSPET